MSRSTLTSSLLCLLALGFLALPASAQGSIPYQKLLLLIAGPSGDRISPTEQGVVSYLNNLRGEYGLSEIQMGTMHFDRPKEAKLLKSSLGLNPSRGVSLALVQLSDKGLPVRTLYKQENVTAASLQAQQSELLAKWSELSGEALPPELGLNPTPPQQGVPPTNPNPPSTNPDNSSAQRKIDQVYSFEGVRSVVTELNDSLSSVWEHFKNAPMRDDRLDVPLRKSTLGLLEASVNLRRAHEEGVLYPFPQLEAVRRAGREWKLAEPQFYLPVEDRSAVSGILHLLDQVETIEYQGHHPK